MLKKYPITIKDYGVVKDKLIPIRKKFQQSASECDVLITTGGVSVGDADFVKDVLNELGKINFWKIAVKPGRPLAFGKIKIAYFLVCQETCFSRSDVQHLCSCQRYVS